MEDVEEVGHRVVLVEDLTPDDVDVFDQLAFRLGVELAAADESLSLPETNMLRQLTKSLGLSQQDYLDLQERHRQHLQH